jgi:hypothetical protein
MTPITITSGADVARGLLGAADVGDGPTDEQRSVITHLLHGYFGDDTDVATLVAIGPDELAARVDDDDHHRVVDLLVVVEYCRHPGIPEQADRVEEYVRALAVDEPFVQVARDALIDSQAHVMEDWSRFREPERHEPNAPAGSGALARRLHGLAVCPEGSLGRAFSDFYTRWGIAYPDEGGDSSTDLVAHDFSHVLAGYDPDAPGELALQAMLVGATGFEHHFSGLTASLSLYEAGKFAAGTIEPKVAALDRPGAAAELAEAFGRGAACTRDFSAIDHLARADEPLDAVRADCGIEPRSASSG